MKWIETDYFKNFRCKCGDCRSSCCDAWDISVSFDEYIRITGIECSEELSKKIRYAFRDADHPTPERYKLFARNYYGQCPLHGENGLCSLHAEKGESAISEICRVFPRSMHCKGGVHRAVCSAGCEAVIEILRNTDQLQFIEVEDDLPVNMTEDADPKLFEIFPVCVSMLRDRIISVAKRIEEICRFLQPSFIASGNESAGLDLCLNTIERLKPFSPILDAFSDEIGNRYADHTAFLHDRMVFDSKYPDSERLFENLLINHLIYEDFPETDTRLKMHESINGLCFAYALMRIMCIARCKAEEPEITDALTNAFRYIEHTSFYYNAYVTIQDPGSLLFI